MRSDITIDFDVKCAVCRESLSYEGELDRQCTYVMKVSPCGTCVEQKDAGA